MSTIVTREWLAAKVAENPNRVIARAIMAIYKRQTIDEQQSATTSKRNGIGFTGADANLGTRCAKHFIKHGELERWMINIWRKPVKNGFPKICKYTKQLNHIAQCTR